VSIGHPEKDILVVQKLVFGQMPDILENYALVLEAG
jgi:hypothetical protein